jgi:hypothetical protein
MARRKHIRIKDGMVLYFNGSKTLRRTARKLPSGRWNVRQGGRVHWYSMPLSSLRALIREGVYTTSPRNRGNGN